LAAPEDAADLALLEAAARRAGALALSYFGRNPTAWTKGAASPVSEADIAVDRLLAETLRAARPDYGWLSEETADSAERLGRRSLFVVDPIDGTRAFLAGSPEWSVSLAVVRDGRPCAAALAAPALGLFYGAAAGAGATRDGVPLRVRDGTDLAAARVAGAKAPLPVILPALGENVPRIPSLALRLARVADGTLDAAFAGADAHDWDVAAADLLVAEAGGRLALLEGGRAPLYNAATPRHGPLVAAGVATLAAILGATRPKPARKGETSGAEPPIRPAVPNGA
jgi:myo-inositol-1(or 4)-monophosphatase